MSKIQIIGVLLLLQFCVAASVSAGTLEDLGNGRGKGIRIQPMIAEGLPIALVYIHLEESTGTPEGDDALKKEIAAALTTQAGDIFRELAVDMEIKKIRALPTLSSASYGVYRSIPSGQVVLVIFALPKRTEDKEGPVGMIPTGDLGAFPLLYEDNRAKLTLILNGGVGVYSDHDPWFGGFGNEFNGRNPLAKDPATSKSVTWGEGYWEPGIGGIVQAADIPLYLYGVATYLFSGTLGDDIYNSGSWSHGEFERLYAGALYKLPGQGNVIDVSLGKQIYQLRDGFLLSKIPVSTSTGERGALYLGPRLASKNTALGRLRIGGVGIDAFMVEPSEVDIVETDTRLLGVNLQYKREGIGTAFTIYYMDACDTTFPFPRKGLRTYNPSIALTDIGGVDGLWAKVEYAYQDHEDYDMAAHAGYGWLGYESSLTWKPGISYRYSFFTGDDPETETVERFDPLFSGGLGNFLPGLVFSKVYKNSNLRTHRVKANIYPAETLELSLDYFQHRADQSNNRGGIGPLNTELPSKDIGEEVTLTSNWYIGKHFFLQGLASVAIPGDALKEILPGDVRPWYTLQASLYMFF